MIATLTGTLVEKMPPQLVLLVGGVGYELSVPMSTFYALPDTGETVSLLTHFVVREDGHFLYGFSSEAERFAFRQLLKISGVGARTALAILSGLSVSDLAEAVASQEVGRLTTVPGIGKKTAERLLLELKDKLTTFVPQQLGVSGHVAWRRDAIHALLALGYNEREAQMALKTLPDHLSLSELIRQALKFLSRV